MIQVVTIGVWLQDCLHVIARTGGALSSEERGAIKVEKRLLADPRRKTACSAIDLLHKFCGERLQEPVRLLRTALPSHSAISDEALFPIGVDGFGERQRHNLVIQTRLVECAAHCRGRLTNHRIRASGKLERSHEAAKAKTEQAEVHRRTSDVWSRRLSLRRVDARELLVVSSPAHERKTCAHAGQGR